MFTLEQVQSLKRRDCVYLQKWKNKKDGTKLYTSQENCMVAGQDQDYISFRNMTTYYKDCKMDEYGITWTLEKAKNSYDMEEN